MENLPKRWTQSEPFCPKSEHFRFSKRAGKDTLLPLSCTSVSMAEYASIFMNMNKYPWKCLNKLLTMPELWIHLIIWHVRQTFEDASGCKWAVVLNMAWLLMQRLCRVPNITHDGSLPSIMPEDASKYLNLPQYTSTWPNITECP